MRTMLAAALLVLGVAFILVASLGVARLPDAFQRMHAATKAGGIGASLVVLGVLVAGGIASPVTGGLVIAFMLLSLSVASQLLARASYVSGARLQGLERGDPLEGVLQRRAGADALDTAHVGTGDDVIDDIGGDVPVRR